MLNTTASFKDAIKSDVRSFKAIALMYFNKIGLYPFATATATSEFDSNTVASQACNGRIVLNDYVGSGSYIYSELKPQQYGWKSGNTTDASGSLTTPEVLTISYNQAITTRNFWCVGLPGYYPIDFSVDVYENGVWVNVATVTGNTDYNWCLRTDNSHTITQARLTITKAAPSSGNIVVQEFGAVVTVVFDGDHIVDMTLLEESAPDSSEPLGEPTSNELGLTLSNHNAWMTPANVSGPFYGLIRPRIKLEAFMGIQVTDGSYEFVPFGTYWTSPWDSSSTDITSNIAAYDRLYDILNKPVPNLGALPNVAIADLFRQLFDALNMVEGTDYIIDQTITATAQKGWVPIGNIGDALYELCKACGASVFVTRLNKVRVADVYNSNASVATVTDDDQIISIDNPLLYLSTYSSIHITFYYCGVSAIKDLGGMDSVSLDAGETKTFEIDLNDMPVVSLNVGLVGGTQPKSLQVSYGVSHASVTITNNGNAYDTFSIVLNGKTVGSMPSSYIASNSNAVDEWGDVPYMLDNVLIQSSDAANTHAGNLLSFVIDPLRAYTMDLTGDPSVEVFDTITFVDNTNNVGSGDVVLTSAKWTYDGGLECSMAARKPI